MRSEVLMAWAQDESPPSISSTGYGCINGLRLFTSLCLISVGPEKGSFVNLYKEDWIKILVFSVPLNMCHSPYQVLRTI
jgi:hypothetical protein